MSELIEFTGQNLDGGCRAVIRFNGEALADQLESALARFPGSIPDQIASEFLQLGDDLIVGDGVTAVLADGTIEVLYTPRFGGRFEDLIAAAGALEIDGAHEAEMISK